MDFSSKLQHILIIDDHPDHVQTIRDTLSHDSKNREIVAIAYPQEAIQYLNRQDQYSNATRPHLILLDPNLATASHQDGLTILSAIKANPQLKRTPIVVLTLSDDTEAIFNSYFLQGNCYVLKSSNLQHLADIVKQIEEFWLGIVKLPTE